MVGSARKKFPRKSGEIEDVRSKIRTGAGEGNLAMKGFLLFLSLGGAALYTLLVFTDDVLQDGKAENTLAVQNQSSHPVAQQLSSWGTYLPSGSPSQKPERSPIRRSSCHLAKRTQLAPSKSRKVRPMQKGTGAYVAGPSSQSRREAFAFPSSALDGSSLPPHPFGNSR
jgi:hypothetical protein